jgi:hypothetical protein
MPVTLRWGPIRESAEWRGAVRGGRNDPAVRARLGGRIVPAVRARLGGRNDPAVRARLVEFGYEIFPREQQTPEALGAMVRADAEKWWPIIKELGIKAE